MIVVIIQCDQGLFRDCTLFKVYDIVERCPPDFRYIIIDDIGDEVGLNGKLDGEDYLIL